MDVVEKYIPELKQGITTEELEHIIAQLTMDKTVAERNMNILLKKYAELRTNFDKVSDELLKLQIQLRQVSTVTSIPRQQGDEQ